MTRPIPRRTVIAAGPLALAGCAYEGPYFGNSTWSDETYDRMLQAANSTVEAPMRMKELARCEAYLLRAMPIVPLLFYGFAGFQKPYVRGLDINLLDTHRFKYAWIDTKWKPERS